jgi:phosphoribosylformylglycinamidine synthase subunit PurL
VGARGGAIGQVTDDGRFRILEDGKVVADIPALPLTEGCPTYEREGIESDEVKALRDGPRRTY